PGGGTPDSLHCTPPAYPRTESDPRTLDRETTCHMRCAPLPRRREPGDTVGGLPASEPGQRGSPSPPEGARAVPSERTKGSRTMAGYTPPAWLAPSRGPAGGAGPPTWRPQRC